MRIYKAKKSFLAIPTFSETAVIAMHLGPKYIVPPGIANAKRSTAGNSRTAAKRVYWS
jgi:hypothetical protein